MQKVIAFRLQSTEQSTNLCPPQHFSNLGREASIMVYLCWLLSSEFDKLAHEAKRCLASDSRALAVRPLNQQWNSKGKYTSSHGGSERFKIFLSGSLLSKTFRSGMCVCLLEWKHHVSVRLHHRCFLLSSSLLWGTAWGRGNMSPSFLSVSEHVCLPVLPPQSRWEEDADTLICIAFNYYNAFRAISLMSCSEWSGGVLWGPGFASLASYRLLNLAGGGCWGCMQPERNTCRHYSGLSTMPTIWFNCPMLFCFRTLSIYLRKCFLPWNKAKVFMLHAKVF